MKNLFLIGILCAASPAYSAVMITDEAFSYTQGFNSATPGAPTADWAIDGFAGSGATITYGGTVTNNNTYYAMTPASESTNHAFGGKIAASGAAATLTLTATNDTGASINSFSIAYTYLQYTTHNRASTISFSYSLDGTSYVTADLTYLVGAITYTAAELTGVSTGNPIATSALLSSSNSATLNLSEGLADGANIYFRFTWATGAGGGNNAHLGVDDFSFAVIPEPATAFLGAFGLLGLLRRRR